MMKKFFFLVMVAAAAISMNAAPVNQTAASAIAKNYLANKMYAGKIMAPAALNPVLLKAEPSTVANENLYYIFNTSSTFLVVAGDDRAETILMVGDKPLKDINNLAPAMQDILKMYKNEIQYLFDHPTIEVEKLSDKMKRQQLNATVYGPLLTAEWDQSAPYNKLCKFTYNNRTYTCMTGCPATSAAMVFYYWQYPTGQIPAMSSYTSTLDIGSYYSNEVSFTYPALEATTFDWVNMKDKYGSYTTAQANAVATLMRYIGQAEKMMYGVTGSGIYSNETQKVADMFKNWGYQNTVSVKYKQYYTATNWANLLIAELAAGRPIIYNGIDDSAGGHAFNVDGYSSSDGLWHVNFGWNGDGNSWYAMNSFTYNGMTFSSGQQAVIGIEPPYQGPTPVLTAEPASLSFEAEPGDTVTQTFTLRGTNLRQDVTLSLSSTAVYSLSKTEFTAEEVTAGVPVTVKFSPKNLITYTATITASSLSAEDITIELSGLGKRIPVLTVEPASLEFAAMVDGRDTQTFVVKGKNITDNVTLEVVDDTEDFYIDKNLILKSGANSESGVTVYATYYPADYGTHNARVIVSGGGAEPVTVYLTGNASVPKETPVMQPAANAYITLSSFRAEWLDESPDYSVDSYTLWLRRAGGSEVTYPGIGPDKFYTFENLVEGGTYYFKVKTLFVDGTESDWSNTEKVTLFDNAHPYDLGDVDHDGMINITDAAILIDYILDKTTPICLVCGDVNGNGSIDIGDASLIIDMIMGK